MKKTLTFLEVLVAGVVLVLSVLGILGMLNYGRRQIIHTQRRVVILNVARNTLEELSNEVRIDTWNTGNLSVGASYTLPNINIGILNITRSYNVTDVDINNDNIEDYRQVNLTVNVQ